MAKIDKSKMKCNVPKRTPSHPTKSHVVKACEGGKEKVIRFGQQGVKGSPPKKGESDADKARRAAFKARHAKNIAKGKMSAAFWADKVKWTIVLTGSILLSGGSYHVEFQPESSYSMSAVQERAIG
jgi:hypothetical protein